MKNRWTKQLAPPQIVEVHNVEVSPPRHEHRHQNSRFPQQTKTTEHSGVGPQALSFRKLIFEVSAVDVDRPHVRAPQVKSYVTVPPAAEQRKKPAGLPAEAPSEHARHDVQNPNLLSRVRHSRKTPSLGSTVSGGPNRNDLAGQHTLPEDHDLGVAMECTIVPSHSSAITTCK